MEIVGCAYLRTLVDRYVHPTLITGKYTMKIPYKLTSSLINRSFSQKNIPTLFTEKAHS